MLNILLRETPSQRQGADQSIVVKKRAIYSTAHLRPIRGGLQVADGFIQSVRPGWQRMVVNVNYTSGVTWQPGPLFELLKEILRMRNWNFPRMLEADSIRGDQLREINKLIKGIKVMAPHLEGRAGKKKRPLVISGLHSKSAQTYRFDCNFGHVSVAQYFQMQYNRALHHPTMCLVSIRSNDEILFPIETLIVLPGQLVAKSVKLLPAQAAEVQKIAQDMKPSPRLRSITDSLRSNQVLAYENAPVLVSSNFRIDLRPMISKARLLPPPDVLYRGNERPSISKGAWNMMRLKVWQSPLPVEKWAICVISPRCDRRTAGEFGRTLVNICGSMGIPLNPNFQIFEGPNPLDLLANCTPATFVLCILNGPETSHKEAIKKWGDIQHGIPTQ
ncbi:Eukaryotic translation initiation factor 2C, partial [Tulasnella sp. 417]